MRLRPFTLLAALVPLVSGCNVEWKRDHPLYCSLQDQTSIRDTLYFGLSIPGGGEVTDVDWKRFETDVIATAFPQGFTVIDAHGAWRGANGETTAEATRIVIITHPDDSAADAAVRALAERYRVMFKQEAVLRESDAVCVSL